MMENEYSNGLGAYHDLHEQAVMPEQIGDMTDIGLELANRANDGHQRGDKDLHAAFVKRAGILIGRDTKGASEIERRSIERQYRELLADTVSIFDAKGLYTYHEQHGGEAYSVAYVTLPLLGVRESECHLDMKFTKIEADGKLVEMQFERTTLPIENDADYHAVTLNTNGLFMFLSHKGQEGMLPADYCSSTYLFVQMNSDEELIKVLYNELESRKR